MRSESPNSVRASMGTPGRTTHHWTLALKGRPAPVKGLGPSIRWDVGHSSIQESVKELLMFAREESTSRPVWHDCHRGPTAFHTNGCPWALLQLPCTIGMGPLAARPGTESRGCYKHLPTYKGLQSLMNGKDWRPSEPREHSGAPSESHCKAPGLTGTLSYRCGEHIQSWPATSNPSHSRVISACYLPSLSQQETGRPHDCLLCTQGCIWMAFCHDEPKSKPPLMRYIRYAGRIFLTRTLNRALTSLSYTSWNLLI